uniref:Uncharacterized protein n=1 Tax=Ascaris lumbricoides TaxID=6252 RepID=A0A0M3II59_ASCLU
MLRLGKYASQFAEKAQEVIEPTMYDVKEAITAALQDMSQLDANETDNRNSLLELYLGCSVLSIGLSAGEISGAFLLGTLYEYIFDWWWELALVFMLPLYVYLTFRKNAALDEIERRVNLFGLALCIGSFMGHLLGKRLVATMPAVIFIQPLIIGLAVDNELSPPSVYSDRRCLLGISSAAGVLFAILLVLFHGLTLSLDEIERRVNLFGLALCIGSFMGHLLGKRLVATMPAVIFIQPLIIGLAVDNELSPPSVYSDRRCLLGISSAAGVLFAILLVLFHGLTLCAISTILLQAAFLFAHFQVTIYCISNKIYGASEAQLCYIIITLLTHVITGGLMGSSAAAMQNDSA